MKELDLMYGCIVILAFVSFYFAKYFFDESKQLLEYGYKTTGEVIKVIEKYDNDGTSYYPVFQYTSISGNKIEFKSTVGSNPSTYKVGEKVRIAYDQLSKNNKIISYWGLYRYTIFLLCIGTSLFIIGSGYFFFTS